MLHRSLYVVCNMMYSSIYIYKKIKAQSTLMTTVCACACACACPREEEAPPSVSAQVCVCRSEEHCGAAGRRSCQTAGTHSRRTEDRAGWQARVWATKWLWCLEHSGAMKGKERWWTCWPRTLTWSADVRLVYENCSVWICEYIPGVLCNVSCDALCSSSTSLFVRKYPWLIREQHVE